MSFSDQKPFTVTAEHITASWCGRRAAKGATTHPLFRCSWCGHRFAVGDVARWVFTNVSGEETEGVHGNPFICSACDGPRPEILAKLRATRAEFEADRFWWFRRNSRETNEAVSEALIEEQRAARDAYDDGYDRGRRDASDGREP
ncbi:MAG TPA: hypothetical protein VMT56_00450 [Candidatus Bathyarchaeia archaeon]|nr:hypothetical protein [Candidatus Bathyarchaeia archaeon]